MWLSLNKSQWPDSAALNLGPGSFLFIELMQRCIKTTWDAKCKCWGFKPKWDIYISHTKAEETSQKRGLKNCTKPGIRGMLIVMRIGDWECLATGETSTHSSSQHSLGKILEEKWKKNKTERMKALKSFLWTWPGCCPTWTHRACSYLHQTCTRSRHVKLQVWRVKRLLRPLPCWGAIGGCWGKDSHYSLERRPPCRLPVYQWMIHTHKQRGTTH